MSAKFSNRVCPKNKKHTFGTPAVYPALTGRNPTDGSFLYRKRYVYDKGQKAFIQLFYMIAKK
jgi:hypothetical protein